MTIDYVDTYHEGRLIHEDRLREAAQVRLANQINKGHAGQLVYRLQAFVVSILH